MKNPVERLDMINSEMDMLRKQKSELSKRNPAHKKELKRIRKRMHQLAKARANLPVTLRWSGEEGSRRKALMKERGLS